MMKRFLIAIFSLTLSLSATGVGRTYYLSSTGNDGNDGLSPEKAWKTLSKVNDNALAPGDRVLFHCGEVFRGQLKPKSGKLSSPVYYGSYGEGIKPVIEPSIDASAVSHWEKVGKKLWRCVLPTETEIGNIIFNDGEAGCAWKVDRREQLKKDLHFCWIKDEKTVYMISEANPGERFSSIELAERHHVIDESGCHDVTYEGLWLRYGAAHGIGGSNVQHITILNCDISWIGGSTNYIDNEGRSVRYGNGIEFWSGAEDVLVENCRVWECWDAGLTNQSNVPDAVQRNIVFRGNEVWNCEYSYEYWQQGDRAVTENVCFENNVCRDAGKGWGHVQRWNPNAAHLMFYDTTAKTNSFVIRSNRFENTENYGMRLFNAWYSSITMKDNVWIIPHHILCRYHGRPTEALVYKYPDRLDVIHRDNRKEIESQTVEKPLVLKGKKALKKFKKKFKFE